MLGVRSAGTGDRGAATFLVLTGWLMLTLAGTALLTRARRGSETSIRTERIDELGSEAISLPYSRSSTLGVYIGLLGLLPVTGTFSMAYVIEAIDERGADLDSIVVGGLNLLLFVSALLALAVLLPRRRGVRMLVAVSPSGIYHRGPNWTAFFPWTEVVAVLAIDLHGPFVELWRDSAEKVYVTDLRYIRLVGVSPRSTANRGIATTSLAVDPALVYYGIRFYHENPHLRAELAYDAGAERFRRADFS
jgi:hypothetical protein